MNAKLENKIFNKFKKLFSNSSLSEIQCEDGWYELIFNLCKKLQHYVDENKCPQIQFVEIKEKLALLRFHIAFEEGNLSEETNREILNMIKKVTDNSFKVCELTGGYGVLCEKNGNLKTLSKESAVLLGYEPIKNY